MYSLKASDSAVMSELFDKTGKDMPIELHTFSAWSAETLGVES